MSAPDTFMDLVRTILVMSLSGSVLTLTFMLIRPLIRHRIPKAAQHALWFVVLAAFLIPVSKIVVLPATGTNITLTQIHSVIGHKIPSAAEEASHTSLVPVDATGVINTYDVSSLAEKPDLFTKVNTGFMVVYPFGVMVQLLYNLVGYAYFRGKIRFRKVVSLSNPDTLAGLCAGKHPPRLYLCPLAATPMLVGLFRPRIILPDREYTNYQLRNILLHELAHQRRRDVFGKWLTMLACSLHWFNPIVWLARREISRACELACDVSVIRHFGVSERKIYGDTLIAMADKVTASKAVLATTLCEERKSLQERLLSIMKYKAPKGSDLMASAMILMISIGAACLLGASSGRALAAPESAAIPDSRTEIIDVSTTYTISYKMNFGYPAIEPQTKTKGEALNLSNIFPERDNMDFMGWIADGRNFQPGDVFDIDANITLHADWQSRIIFDPNGGTGAPDSIYRSYTLEPTTLPDIKPTRPGFTFLGWANDPGASEPDYLPGGNYDRLIARHVTIYAVWVQ
ncbi:MAG: InlB B-repeat-containing protein [Peptococcaceae bacterium]|nr:InlB B-repeat-containing protein [Peptococcaceae bacterium]